MKYLKISIRLVFILLAFNSMQSFAGNVTAKVRDLKKGEIEKYNGFESDFSILEVSNGYMDRNELLSSDGRPSSIKYVDNVQCGSKKYIAVIAGVDFYAPVNTFLYDYLYVYDRYLTPVRTFETVESVDSASSHGEGLYVSKQPMYSLKSVEEFVCNSVKNFCDDSENVYAQCSLSNGKQAFICENKHQKNEFVYRFGTLNKIEFEHRGINSFHREEDVKKGNEYLYGNKGIYFINEKYKYSLKEYWSSKNIDSRNYHSQLSVDKEGKNIMTAECKESSVFY